MLQATAPLPLDPERLAKTLSKGKGAGASFDPGTRLLDDKLARAKAAQEAKDREWRDKVSGALACARAGFRFGVLARGGMGK